VKLHQTEKLKTKRQKNVVIMESFNGLGVKKRIIKWPNVLIGFSLQP
jgi:hypothetical protein